MSISDEILKLKQLLDNGAITQEEFDQMKSNLLKSGSLTSKPQVTPTSTTPVARPTTTYAQRPISSYYTRGSYFNDTPFKVIGWISFGFAALFSLICIILLACKQYGAAFAMVWELTFLPGGIGIVMGAIIKNKEDSSVLLVLNILFAIISLIVCIVASVTYAQNLSQYYYYY